MKTKRITIKIGSRVLTGKDNTLNRVILKRIAREVAVLKERGTEVIIVSSGAIAAGLGHMKTTKKRLSLSGLQAAASIGQTQLMDAYNKHFGDLGFVAGQILLTQDDFNDRKRFLNIRYTIDALLKFGAVPVINENDSVSTEEIKCGDNDRLSSLVADLARSDMLVLLTDVDGVYDNNGAILEAVEKVDGRIASFCKGKGCEESTCGMKTKLEAVRSASQAGIKCIIANGHWRNVLQDIVSGKKIGTFFQPAKKAMSAKKRWIAFGSKPKGCIVVDDGARKAIAKSSKSLLPSGICEVKDSFKQGDVINIITTKGEVIARGLSNYTSDEIIKIKGLKTVHIERELGYKDYDEVIQRDNMIILE